MSRPNSSLSFQVDRLEERRMLAADLYVPAVDPSVGAVVTAFLEFDPSDPGDAWDIRSNWLDAVDELAQLRASEVTFAVYRLVDANGNLRGGPSIETVEAAVQRAVERGLTTTILPLFEVDDVGWRGDYNPTGSARTNFQNGYAAFVTALAQIEGVERLNIGSELNAMVNDTSNLAFFQDLAASARAAGYEEALGYAANFDAYDNAAHQALWQLNDIDFMGVSAYFNVIAPGNADAVSATSRVSKSLLKAMVANWTIQLDALAQFASTQELPVVIQEFGATALNYASIYPWATSPGDVLGAGDNLLEQDKNEQRALYESLLTALDGRGSEFESVAFWAWEHGADRGARTYEGADPDETQYINQFAVWQDDGGGGEFLADFWASQKANFEIESNTLTVYGTGAADKIQLLPGSKDNADGLTLKLNGARHNIVAPIDEIIVFGFAGNDKISASGSKKFTHSVTFFGGMGNDKLIGSQQDDVLDGGDGKDVLTGKNGDDELIGGDHEDKLSGGNGFDILVGGFGFGFEGDDFLTDKLNGGKGADMYVFALNDRFAFKVGEDFFDSSEA